ncbi:MAG: DNA-3-methyladenine glycosylase 2 family protein [Lachnospiraceae bacterium]|nr:DNA-3-methyladenine glycosylase 2 family protein [Lachnospiraceae bacterium]
MRITVKDDLDLYKITNSGQCFRACEISPGLYRFITGRNILYIKDISGEEYELSCSKKEWDGIWKHYFDIETDYSSIRAGIPAKDKFLKECADAGCGIRILNQDKWEMLISFIISQRKSIPAIRSCIEKLCERFGEKLESLGDGSCGDIPETGSLCAFPTPKALLTSSEKELGECGLGYRTPFIKDAAERVCSGKLDLDALDGFSDEELFVTLKTVKGVGDKVANCVMLFGYHRIGRAPVDTWIYKVIDQKYNGRNPFGDYGIYAGIMQQYMFYGAAALKLLK